MPFWSAKSKDTTETPQPQEQQEPEQQQQPKKTFSSLQPPIASNANYDRPQQGVGVGRESKTPILIADDLTHKGKTKLFTDCKTEYIASINCRLENYDHKETNVCQPLFDTYKACRKEENDRRLEENARSGRGLF